jgi:hypothetical protein
VRTFANLKLSDKGYAMTMITLTANDNMLAALRQATDVVEIRDAQGTVVGYFAPVSADRAHLYQQEQPKVEESGKEVGPRQ